jgi:hypothetical protein
MSILLSPARRSSLSIPASSCVALACLLASFAAQAQPEADAAIEAAEPAPGGFGLGLAVNSRQSPYLGVDRKNRVLQVITY